MSGPKRKDVYYCNDAAFQHSLKWQGLQFFQEQQMENVITALWQEHIYIQEYWLVGCPVSDQYGLEKIKDLEKPFMCE